MSNNKQSSIEWLINFFENGVTSREEWLQAKEKAKAMHKEEHGKTWDKSIDNLELRGGNHIRAWVDFDDYYNETFGGNNED